MGSFIAKQPNGLYCRFSTVVGCPTHYNMTQEEYINNITGTVKDKENGEDTLRNFLRPFSEVKDRFKPINMTEEEFYKLVKTISEKPKSKGFKTT
ncbi:hypothetical protein ACTQ4P_05505 [Clostridium sporogenes]|uniref:hypothetical protein n=1 Tax=Clostridium sporogenes TaxID=1509 RepID=UPI00290314BC|nr:hypothetical protein [Clostridium botulinum]